MARKKMQKDSKEELQEELQEDERFIRGYKYEVTLFVGKNKIMKETIDAVFLGRSYNFLKFERIFPINVSFPNSNIFSGKKKSFTISVHTSLIGNFKQLN